jgi:hypothetical protein
MTTRKEQILKALTRPARVAVAVAVIMAVSGTGVAAADTHTGYQAIITCDGTAIDVVTPTGPAAASQDTASRRVIVFAVGAALAPDHFPAGKVQYCDFYNVTTDYSPPDPFPFLVRGRP